MEVKFTFADSLFKKITVQNSVCHINNIGNEARLPEALKRFNVSPKRLNNKSDGGKLPLLSVKYAENILFCK